MRRRDRLLLDASVSQCPLAIVVKADLTHAIRTEPAEQRGRPLLNLDAAALAAPALLREDYDHLGTLEELLRFGAVRVPSLADLRSPLHDAVVSLVHAWVEYALRKVKANSRIEQVLELTPPRLQGAPHDLHVGRAHLRSVVRPSAAGSQPCLPWAYINLCISFPE